jgi:RES domain-containing protein
VLHRVTGATYAADLSGEGARLNKGRWNNAGTAVVYTSESLEVAFSEYARRYVPRELIKSVRLGYVRFQLPAGISVEEVDLEALPEDWRSRPAPERLQLIGDAWTRSGRTCLLKVPTALNAEDFNYLINPQHPEFNQDWATVTMPFAVTDELVEASKRIAPEGT